MEKRSQRREGYHSFVLNFTNLIIGTFRFLFVFPHIILVDSRPVDGQWSPWSQFSTCEGHCGRGQKTRSRHCSQPPPANGGKPCNDSAGGKSPQYETVPCEVTCMTSSPSRDHQHVITTTLVADQYTSNGKACELST